MQNVRNGAFAEYRFRVYRLGLQATRGLGILLLAASLAACAFPRKDFAPMPDPSVIRLQQQDGVLQALPPDCERLRQPSQYNTMTDLRMDIAFGCATYTNLSQQARPEDLARPRSYGGQSAETAATAVERYRTGNVTPLMQTSTTDVGN